MSTEREKSLRDWMAWNSLMGGDHGGPVSVCHLLCNQRNGWRYYSISWYRDSICSAISWGQHLSDIPTYIFKSLKDHLTMMMMMMGKLVSTGLIMMMKMLSSWIDCWGNKKFQAPAGAGGTTNKAGNWAVRGWEEAALADIQQSLQILKYNFKREKNSKPFLVIPFISAKSQLNVVSYNLEGYFLYYRA